MANYERLCRTLRGESVDRLMTWDYIDNDAIVTRHGGYDPARQYDFAELLDINARGTQKVSELFVRQASNASTGLLPAPSSPPP